MDDLVEALKQRAEAALSQLVAGSPGGDSAVDATANELRAALQQHPETGSILGPLLRRLQAARQSTVDRLLVHWIEVGGGHLAIGHRPKIKLIPALHEQGATHVLTLLSETEGAAAIGHAVQRAGMAWLWFPLVSAVPPGPEKLDEVRRLFDRLRAALSAGGKIFVHCSAGIHRTGMISYGLLRSVGLPQSEALSKLRSLRAVTGEGVGAERLAWGDQFGD